MIEESKLTDLEIFEALLNKANIIYTITEINNEYWLTIKRYPLGLYPNQINTYWIFKSNKTLKAHHVEVL